MHDMKRLFSGCALLGLLVLAGCAPSSSEEQAAKAAPKPGVAATIGDQTITLEELDSRAQVLNMKAYQQLYDTRRQVLQQMVDQRVIEAEAKARGVSVEELVRVEVDKRAKAVTDADIQTFYTQNQARMQGKTLDELRDQIRAFLSRQQSALAQQQFTNELREKVAIQIDIEPPRIEVVVAQNERQKGPDTAKVTIVEYSDFQ